MRIAKISKYSFSDPLFAAITTKNRYCTVAINNPTIIASVIFNDLEFLSKIDLTRSGQFELINFCLKHNIPFRAAEKHKRYLNRGNVEKTKREILLDSIGKGTSRWEKYIPESLSESGAIQYQKILDEGEFVICQFID